MDQSLPLPQYQWWYDSIVSDDIQSIRFNLQHTQGIQKQRILNGWFQNLIQGDDKNLNNDKPIGYSWLKELTSFTLAVASEASDRTLLELLWAGVNLALKNSEGNNCLHIMVSLAYMKPQCEDYMRNVYGLVEKTVSPATIKSLLHHANDTDFTPLELAANYGVIGLFIDIFHTPDVYITHTKTMGPCAKQYFDITQYESTEGIRSYRNPLFLLAMMERSGLCNKYVDDIFKSAVFKE